MNEDQERTFDPPHIEPGRLVRTDSEAAGLAAREAWEREEDSFGGSELARRTRMEGEV